jgi:hypothetical protein
MIQSGLSSLLAAPTGKRHSLLDHQVFQSLWTASSMNGPMQTTRGGYRLVFERELSVTRCA